jgi:flagellar basal body-associated protein FliL
MKYEKKNRIFIYIIVLLAVLLFGTTVYGIYCTNKLDKTGRLVDQLTERLSDATDTNRRLTETVEQCQFIVTELGSTTNRSIGTVREAVEVIEETREAVGALEVELGIWDSDSVYDRIDSWLSSELKKQ